jgi:hypothetical protein
MKMVVHQHVAAGPEAIPFALLAQQLQKLQPVGFIPKNVPPLIAARRDMVAPPGPRLERIMTMMGFGSLLTAI